MSDALQASADRVNAANAADDAAHGAIRYLGQSQTAGAAYRCDDCGAHWYPDMGERPPSRCYVIPANRNPYRTEPPMG